MSWWLRLVPGVRAGRVGVELWPTDPPVLRLTQGSHRIDVDLDHVKALVAVLTDAEADLAGAMASRKVPT